jgi:hypothetical protein
MNKELMIHVGIGFAAVVVIFLLYKNAKGTPAPLTWEQELGNIFTTGNSQGYSSPSQGSLPTFLGITY